MLMWQSVYIPYIFTYFYNHVIISFTYNSYLFLHLNKNITKSKIIIKLYAFDIDYKFSHEK